MAKSTELNVTTLTEADKAYMAAMLDGEGVVSVKKVKYKDYFYCYPVIAVYNCNMQLMKWLVSKYGGTISVTKKQGADGKYGKAKKDVYRWRTTSVDTAVILEHVYPYLIIKRAQAELGLKLNTMNHRANKEKDKFGKFKQMLFPTMLSEIETIHKSIRLLNNPEWANKSRTATC